MANHVFDLAFLYYLIVKLYADFQGGVPPTRLILYIIGKVELVINPETIPVNGKLLRRNTGKIVLNIGKLKI